MLLARRKALNTNAHCRRCQIVNVAMRLSLGFTLFVCFLALHKHRPKITQDCVWLLAVGCWLLRIIVIRICCTACAIRSHEYSGYLAMGYNRSYEMSNCTVSHKFACATCGNVVSIALAHCSRLYFKARHHITVSEHLTQVLNRTPKSMLVFHRNNAMHRTLALSSYQSTAFNLPKT